MRRGNRDIKENQPESSGCGAAIDILRYREDTHCAMRPGGGSNNAHAEMSVTKLSNSLFIRYPVTNELLVHHRINPTNWHPL